MPFPRRSSLMSILGRLFYLALGMALFPAGYMLYTALASPYGHHNSRNLEMWRDMQVLSSGFKTDPDAFRSPQALGSYLETLSRQKKITAFTRYSTLIAVINRPDTTETPFFIIAPSRSSYFSTAIDSTGDIKNQLLTPASP